MNLLELLKTEDLKKVLPTVKEVREGLVKRELEEVKKRLQIVRAKAAYLGMLS